LWFYTDNSSAIISILNPSAHPGQLLSISACTVARDWLSGNPQRSIHLSWCPAHSDIPQNDLVDELAKNA
ncbi:hypothetical protein BD779DRAFT_1415909, partial [Infundibulicybe gibba]